MFSIIDKKNNKTSLFDAEREISTLGSTDDAGLPSVRHYPLTRGLRYLGLHHRPMLDYIKHLKRLSQLQQRHS